MNILINKVALVTGGSRGIGKSISLALSKKGVNIFFTYREDDLSAKNLLSEINNFGGKAKGFKSDVRDVNSIEESLKLCVKTFGGIDILVNNAGINKPTDFDLVTEDDWDEILSVNLKGPFLYSQKAIPYLKKRGGGSIINIGSVSGQYGGPRTAHYAASKAGLISLSQVIARFGAKDNIRCNTVSAGLIASEMAEKGLQSASVKKAAESVLLNRLGTSKEVADAVLFLASDDSSYITAQTINVNGGLYF